MEFFDKVGGRLTGLLITQSPRVDLEVIESLVKNCPGLTELRLAEIGQMSDVLLGPLGQLTDLRLLDLSSPGSELTDGAVSELLQKVGKNLEELDLSGTDLTDEVLPAIARSCPQLKRLRLRHLDLHDAAVASLFESLTRDGRPGLVEIDMEKGHELSGPALTALIQHSGRTMEKLSICGWSKTEAVALEQLAHCKVLRDLDIGWCRNVTDFVVKDLLDGCAELKLLRVWGEWYMSRCVLMTQGAIS